MTEKNSRLEPRTKSMCPLVAARNVRQWNCPNVAAESLLGLSMDQAIRIGRPPVVPGPIAQAPPPCPASQRRPRADGGSHPSPAQEQTQSLGILGGRGHPPRFDRPGSPPLAVESDDPSDFGPSPLGDAQATRSKSARATSARPGRPSPERRAPARLYRRALSGVSVALCGHKPQGRGERAGQWDHRARSTGPASRGLFDQGLAPKRPSQVFANGQRHELDRGSFPSPQLGTIGAILFGLSGDSRVYSRATTCLQCSRRTLQRPVARESLEAVLVPLAGAAADSFPNLSGGLQYLSQETIDPAGGELSLPDRPASVAQTGPSASPTDPLSGPNLDYPKSR